MRERLQNLKIRCQQFLTPSAAAWQGAAIGIYVLVTILVAFFFAAYFVQDFTLQKLPAYVVRLGMVIALGSAAALVVALVSRLPSAYRLALLVFAPFVLMVFAPGDDKESAIFTALLLLFVSLIGGGIAVLAGNGYQLRQHRTALVAVAAGILGLLGGIYAVFSDIDPPNPQLDDYVLADRTLDLPNPGLPGDFDVLSLSYGSGKDRHREEYGDGADLVSRSVDGSQLIDNWDGFSGWLRSSYWGFDATELPLQARVWYPAGNGPFPLVLIVHGNHSMEDYSDPGYEYLGRHFASNGIILASVDENFINSSISAWVDVTLDRPGLKEENDARGWLLLEHLRQWRDWNLEPGHHFFGKIDIDRVALIGHSRGGEAVGIAAAFNALDRYPDDATLDFDFGFNLRGVIAIAPVDGQYQPRDRGTPVRDVNYFTIHGDMDGDVQSFEGIAQYSRVAFLTDDFRFKSSLYVVGANHGQFNTTWENLDTGIFRAWTLDLDRIMEGEAQRDVARVYFSAFMEIVLRDRFEYLPVFADARYAAKWLPQTFYINQLATNRQHTIADFEEDIDPTTTTVAGGRIEAENLSRWYEVRNTLKYDDLETHALVLAWDEEYSADPARLDFLLLGARPTTDVDAAIVASISVLDIETLPEDFEADQGDDSGDPASDAATDEPEPLDWRVEVSDRSGAIASLPLSADHALYPLVNAIPRRSLFLDGDEPTEVLFRRFEFPLRAFREAEPAFDPENLSRISFVFDGSPKGAIIVDDVSISPRLPGSEE